MELTHDLQSNFPCFPSKLLLIGEYLAVNGGNSLAIPFDKFQGHFGYEDTKTLSKLDWNKYIAYLKEKEISLDYNLLAADIEKGLCFCSTIPIGAGLGSSGALVAATYATYAVQKEISSLGDLKFIFSNMEGFFHGSSSGIDPLVIYLNEAVLIDNGKIKTPKVNQDLLKDLFVIDSKISRSTGPLVQYYKDHIANDYKADLEELILLNDYLIAAMTSSHDSNKFNAVFKEISTLQAKVFRHMIPKWIYKLWMDGLEDDGYYMKLCGAGGGGFFYLLSNKRQPTGTFLSYPVWQNIL